jgi:ParB-like chromosome segregation protein Spo0J
MFEAEILPLTKIKANPNNPRLVKDDKFKKLVKSIQDFPQMLNIRPIVVNEDMIVLGGNMRLKACKEAGLKEVPVIKASSLTEEQQREFIIKDNVGYGEWDWDVIANEWDAEQVTDWGLDIPGFMKMPSEDELIGEDKNKPPVMKITFDSPEQLQAAENDIRELIDRKYQGAYYSVSAGEI